MAQIIEINNGDTVNVIEVQLPFYGVAGSELEFGARAEEAISIGNVVYVSGAQGTHIQVSKALASAEATSAGSIGIAKQSAALNADVQVVTFGLVPNLNTQAYAEGQVLYLSSTVAGGWQTTLPVAPNHGVRVGWVVRSHPSLGQVFVDIQNYQELDELSDVNVSGATNGQVLTYQSSNGTWVPSTPNPGDITAVNVTSPITGGGTGGDVTIGINQSALSLTASQISDGNTTWARLAAANTFTASQFISASDPSFTITSTTNSRSMTIQPSSGGLSTSGAAMHLNRFPGNSVVVGLNSDSRLSVGQGGASPPSSIFFVANGGGLTTIPVAIVRGAASQSANLQEWQNDSGTVLSRVSSSGQFVSDQQTFFGAGAASIANSRLNVASGSASVIGAVIRGAASQTANLQEWQNSAGTILGRIDSAGSGFFAYVNSGGAVSGAQYTGQNVSAGTVGMRLRAHASQSANMIEIQNSSGTNVASVSSAGIIYGSSLRTNSNWGLMVEETSGATMTLLKTISTPNAPGASGYGKLYFRDGTNAGTLKLVVRAGASGAETTILDNIPQ